MTANICLFYLIAIIVLRVKSHSLQERNVLENVVLIVDHHVKKYVHVNILIITGVQASGLITDRLLRQCCFVYSDKS